ncbi:BT_3987 domain-containing protein [Alistipes sp.]|uniref:BT_3987 domain-containing protein n=1 Tax=Alistipes sp. TaxID=1872444 RepID=UPI003AF16651
MKTRYFKSGALAAAAALICAAAVSCADDIVVGSPVDEGAYDGIHENTVLVQDANSGKSSVEVDFSGGSFSTDIKIGLSQAPAAPVEVRVAVDTDYLTEYNKQHGTDYKPYPASLVTFANEGAVTVAAGAKNATVAMTINTDPEMVLGETYAVPVAVTTAGSGLTLKPRASRCLYLIEAKEELPTCHKGDDLPKGFLFFEVNDANPLNALAYELEDGRLLWDAVVLFAANINHNLEEDRPYIQCNPNVQFLLDNNEKFLQPLRKRGIKVILGLLGNHDKAGLAQLSDQGAKDFAAEVAAYCEAYNLDGVNYDDEYSDYPDTSHPAYTRPSTAAAARLCYETKLAMPDKLVTVFDWGSMYGVGTVDEVGAAKWIDVVVANYGSSAYPVGDMTKKACSGCSMEFWLGSGGSLNASKAQQLIDGGYGWFMGFAANPVRDGRPNFSASFNRLQGGPEVLYGSPLKSPTFYYKKNDPNPYPYPF